MLPYNFSRTCVFHAHSQSVRPLDNYSVKTSSSAFKWIAYIGTTPSLSPFLTAAFKAAISRQRLDGGSGKHKSRDLAFPSVTITFGERDWGCSIFFQPCTSGRCLITFAPNNAADNECPVCLCCSVCWNKRHLLFFFAPFDVLSHITVITVHGWRIDHYLYLFFLKPRLNKPKNAHK